MFFQERLLKTKKREGRFLIKKASNNLDAFLFYINSNFKSE